MVSGKGAGRIPYPRYPTPRKAMGPGIMKGPSTRETIPPSTPVWTDWQTPVKTLPSRNFVLRAVITFNCPVQYSSEKCVSDGWWETEHLLIRFKLNQLTLESKMHFHQFWSAKLTDVETKKCELSDPLCPLSGITLIRVHLLLDNISAQQRFYGCTNMG